MAHPTPTPSARSRFVAGLSARERAVLELEPKGPLVRMTFDPLGATSEALAVIDTIHTKVPELAAIPGFDRPALERLRTIAEVAAGLERARRREYASGALHAREAARKATIAAARKLRRLLVALLPGCVEAGAFDPAEVARLELTGEQARLADELSALSALFLEHWSAVGGGVLKREVLEAVEPKSLELKLAVMPSKTRRRKPDPGSFEVDRRRVFTLLFEGYAELKAAVALVRVHHGDVDRLVPSLLHRRAPVKGSDPAASARAAPVASAPPRTRARRVSGRARRPASPPEPGPHAP